MLTTTDSILNKNWYIIRTWKNCELQVFNQLTRKNIKAYCPKTCRQFTTSVGKVNDLPILLFDRFVFVNIEEKLISVLKNERGVCNFIYALSSPARILEVDIEAIQNFVSLYKYVTLLNYPINPNTCTQIRVDKSMKPRISLDLDNTIIVSKLKSLGYILVARSPELLVNEIITRKRIEVTGLK